MQPSKVTEFDIDLLSQLNRWRAFVAIGELGSVTRAALFLDSNQSLLSRQLNALERDCGGRLFDRTGRGVQLSELGERIFPRIKMLLAEAAQLEQDIRSEGREPTGRVAVGMLPSISEALTAHLYAQIRARWPGLSLKILEGSGGQVAEWLADARVDIAILYRYGSSVPEQEQTLASVESYLIGRPGDALTARDTVRFVDLDRLPLILPSAPNGLRAALDTAARHQHITLSPAIEADSLPLQKSLPGREAIYAVLPIHAVWNEVATNGLQAARITEPSLQRSIVMATARSKAPTRAVKAVAAQIDASFQELARTGMWRRGQETSGA